MAHLYWLRWGDQFPDKRPLDGPVANSYELSDFLGDTAVIAAISFIAYVLGAIVCVPVEGKPANVFLAYATPSVTRPWRL